MKFVVFILAIWVAVSASPAPAPQSLSQSLTDTLTHYLGQTFHSYLGTIEKNEESGSSKTYICPDESKFKYTGTLYESTVRNKCSFIKDCAHLKVDGCSAPYLSKGIFDHWFRASCVIHDYCYRNRGWFSRRSKEDCDSEFASNMFAQCDGQTSCQAAALACTEAVATNKAQKAFDDADSC